MSGLQLTPEEYVTEIVMSKDLFLLVEGSDDEAFFILIYNKIKNIYPSLSSEQLSLLEKIRIETAQEIKAPLGNRDKVETVCSLVLKEQEKVSKRILGFVDREFREFEYSKFLQDKLETHKINGRLIWSRGHSIENYFFDIATWRETFNIYPISSFYHKAFDIFESKFDDILRISCSLSLAVLSEKLIDPIQKTLDWKFIDITSKSIEINLEQWTKILRQKNKFDQIRVDNLIDKFKLYLEITYRHDVKIARWLSHGHIGFNLMFAVYGKCLYTAALSDNSRNPDEEANKINKNKDMRFSIAANSWTRNKFLESQNNNINDLPIQCFWMLIENIK